ncbi:cytochrome c oxidase accessory protein CcoG [Azohydromonas sediminis]|uniref:cytochrome c oxidase accessory protein CcoG n=1 Tax=Azohydromonas sediminis TaxID=2259674 RepID=UPI000E6499D0|nr:cytochrome c oxidase accessory protein CcoG [Azohydromonas sediminis]
MYEKQAKIYPRAVGGVFARWRWAMVWLTQLVFYGLPWLQWNGRQAVLFDLVERRFHLFGLLLWPQDLVYLAALLVISALVLFFFTAVAGRLWCGYACPQTVYTEIFLWLERVTEGDRQARMKLDAAPWSARKALRKGGKHALWGLLSLFTGFTFVGYFTPIRELAPATLQFGLGPWETFWILFYAFATYGNAGWMREQICKYMCPYARFQSTLIDQDSLIIAYDTTRGDPRGSRSRRADPKALGLGDCVDCTLCVQVCPTGIDIRNGLQNECIGCAACIDVCDDVMGKMGYAPGLIRYATARGLAAGGDWRQMFARLGRPRVWIYGALLLATSAAFVAGLAARAPFAVDVIRDRGALARPGELGGFENSYQLRLINRTEQAQAYRITVEGLPNLEVLQGDRAATTAAGIGHTGVRLLLPPADVAAVAPGAHPVTFVVRAVDDDERTVATVREASTFFVPR